MHNILTHSKLSGSFHIATLQASIDISVRGL